MSNTSLSSTREKIAITETARPGISPWGTMAKYVVLILLSLIVAGPVLTAILGSLRPNVEFMVEPFGFPRGEIQWVHYTDILENSIFWLYLKNSLIITAGTTILNVTMGSMLAFVLSRIRFRGRGLLFNIISFGLLFPLVVAILPIFIQIKRMGLTGSLWAVILPLAAFGLPGTIIILRGFFMAIPIELEEASYLDGCTHFGFFYRILVPLARPSLTAVAVLQVIYSWNNYFLPLLVLPRSDQWPLPLGLMQFQSQFTTDYSRVMAYVVILIIPAILFYLFAEKYIVTGLTGGELKG